MRNILLIAIILLTMVASYVLAESSSKSYSSEEPSNKISLINSEIVWAAIIASVLTISGVMITNIIHFVTVRKQLRHDSEQRNRDREMAFRRDVYLKAAESIADSMSGLMNLLNLNISIEEHTKEYSGESAAMDKILLIGNTYTIEAVSQFSSELADSMLKLISKRQPLIEQKEAIDILNKLIDKSEAEQDRMLTMMKEFNLKGSIDQRSWDVIEKNYNFALDQAAKLTTKRDNLMKKQHAEHLIFAKGCFDDYAKISRLINPMIIAVRAELNLPIDDKRLNEILKDNMNARAKSYQQFLEGVGNTDEA